MSPGQNPPNVEQAVPFFMVRSMDASLRFYVDGLGFTMTRQWVPRGHIGVSIWFQCKDAIAICREVRSRGVDAKRPFVGNGMWDTSVVDTGGYSIHFESPTDVPEETELEE